MGTVTLGYRPAGTDTRDIAALLSDLDAIVAEINGGLDDDNIADGLKGSKLDVSVFGAAYSGGMTPNASWQDIPGMSYVVNEPTDSALMTMTQIEGTASGGPLNCGLRITLDGVAIWEAQRTLSSAAQIVDLSVMGIYANPLPAGSHTVKAQCYISGGALNLVAGGSSCRLYGMALGT